MDDRRMFFFTGFFINNLAFIITVYLLGKGAVEGNPIMRIFFSYGVYGIFIAFLFSIFVWTLTYISLVYMPEKAKKNREVWLKSSKYACMVLAILCFIDFLNDLIWLLVVI